MISQAKLFGGLMQQGPRLTELMLVLLLAWMVAGWLVPQPVKGILKPNTQGMPAASSLPEMALLLSSPLFGVKAAAPVAPKPVSQPVQVSRLNIKLLGTVVAGAHSAAIVKLASSREQNVFFIGDAIQPGVKLQSVEEAAIVVERNGKLERISMEEGSKLSGASVSPVRASAPRRPRMHRRVNRNHLQSQIRDFPKLLSQARVIPHFIDGKADGFVISDIVPGSLYGQVGLQNGDIIRKVNGQQVTSAEQAMAMYQALQNAPSIDVELMRAGQVQQVHYDIR